MLFNRLFSGEAVLNLEKPTYSLIANNLRSFTGFVKEP